MTKADRTDEIFERIAKFYEIADENSIKLCVFYSCGIFNLEIFVQSR